MRKIVSILLIIFTSFSAYAVDETKISSYVHDLINQSFSILKDNSKSIDKKIIESEALISKNMDLEWMSKFVLGRYRRSLTPQQQAEFAKLYSVYVVKSYSSGVKSFKNQDIKIKSQQQLNSSGDFLVKTLLLRPDADPLQIDYLVRETKSGYKVFDVVTEGISLVNSHQAEFTNTISNESFDELISDIKNKIKSLENGSNNGTTATK